MEPGGGIGRGILLIGPKIPPFGFFLGVRSRSFGVFFFAGRFILSHSISHWKRRFAVAPPEPGYSGLIHYSIFQFPDPIAARIKRRVRS